MSTRHTPGKWYVNLDQQFTLDGDSVEIVALNDAGMVTRSICTCLIDTTDWPNSKEAQEDAANARLIAAAPELLEQLQRLVNITYCEDQFVTIEDCGEARQIISKLINP